MLFRNSDPLPDAKIRKWTKSKLINARLKIFKVKYVIKAAYWHIRPMYLTNWLPNDLNYYGLEGMPDGKE